VPNGISAADGCVAAAAVVPAACTGASETWSKEARSLPRHLNPAGASCIQRLLQLQLVTATCDLFTITDDVCWALLLPLYTAVLHAESAGRSGFGKGFTPQVAPLSSLLGKLQARQAALSAK
jgi:hypothetical protein